MRVECYSGYKADERPIRFYLGEQEYVVRRIVDRWYSPDATCFRIEANDGNVYTLRRALCDGSPAWDLL